VIRLFTLAELDGTPRLSLKYLESHGARKCRPKEHPAEYMLDIVNRTTNDYGEDWHFVWRSSIERHIVASEIDRIHREAQQDNPVAENAVETHGEFATTLTTQIRHVTYRIFQQYWHTPSYMFSKLILGGAAGLFVGFRFYQTADSLTEVQSVLFCFAFSCLQLFSPPWSKR
jgi:ATP-binding cassette subfamily G (WHITE) protein 2 (PDR)